MIRKFFAVAVMAGFAAACGNDRDGDDTLQQDTIIQTVPAQDTLMIEQTITVDTLQQPDRMQGDTVRRDTMPR